jgi:adenylosuccinate synthase
VIGPESKGEAMPTAQVADAGWGDSGKGKVVDLYSEFADVVVRYGGGANAGHTVWGDDGQIITHLVPCGYRNPSARLALGDGMVVDPLQLLKERDELKGHGINIHDLLMLSERATIVFPFHKRIDELREARKGAIGTTKRGIGPAYEDLAARRGFPMWVLLRPNLFADTIGLQLDHADMELGSLSGGSEQVDRFEVFALLNEWAGQLKSYICNVSQFLRDQIARNSNVLFEGHQGTLLDLVHGHYPYVTSTGTLAGAVYEGAGIPPGSIDKLIMICKAYCTRVGQGPFPTKLRLDDNATGQHLSQKGVEKGATTGRLRDCGHSDGLLLGYAAELNRPNSLAVTKLDVLSGLDLLEVCDAYIIGAEPVHAVPASTEECMRAEAVYHTMEGFTLDPERDYRTIQDLPQAAQEYLRFFTRATGGVPVGYVSLGPKRHQGTKINPFV